jgi:hypothetical protein
MGLPIRRLIFVVTGGRFAGLELFLCGRRRKLDGFIRYQHQGIRPEAGGGDEFLLLVGVGGGLVERGCFRIEQFHNPFPILIPVRRP